MPPRVILRVDQAFLDSIIDAAGAVPTTIEIVGPTVTPDDPTGDFVIWDEDMEPERGPTSPRCHALAHNGFPANHLQYLRLIGGRWTWVCQSTAC